MRPSRPSRSISTALGASFFSAAPSLALVPFCFFSSWSRGPGLASSVSFRGPTGLATSARRGRAARRVEPA